ncbi:S-adenosyl-L-methionine-dependent methyltransferase [Scenedesmus sp. NREL 46B-D3]|nr:S-adenosyl-L-methionine-dependent methyltransferase [Scenedesmus sp. NREL 46B-D3]
MHVHAPAGDNVLSKVVNWMINTKPIFGVMRLGAKNAMKSTTSKAGIDWDGHVRKMQQTAELQQLFQEFSQQPHPNLQYPSYYTMPFHAYEDGNLNWQRRSQCCGWQCKPSGLGADLLPAQGRLSADAAACVLVTALLHSRTPQAYHSRHGLAAPGSILDVGCSTGISSRWYQRAYPGAAITGLDLSPYFLAVAEAEERRRTAADPSIKRISFERGLAESTGYADGSWDLAVFSFIAHECPQQALRDFVREARRIIKPGGVVCFVDNNPRSKTIQNLPPVLFTLMKSTEPWTDEYYSFDLEAALGKEALTMW